MKKIAIINGPNLNLLGKREPGVYGNQSFEEYFEELKAKLCEVKLEFQQTNSEGELIDMIQGAIDNFDGLIINAAGYTHTSVAIGDAIAAIATPVVEVHISNVHAREEFRKLSHVSAKAAGSIIGLGLKGYELGVLYLIKG